MGFHDVCCGNHEDMDDIPTVCTTGVFVGSLACWFLQKWENHPPKPTSIGVQLTRFRVESRVKERWSETRWKTRFLSILRGSQYEPMASLKVLGVFLKGISTCPCMFLLGCNIYWSLQNVLAYVQKWGISPIGCHERVVGQISSGNQGIWG